MLKILTAAATADPDARARFLREARMARNVAHENITIYDFGEERGRNERVIPAPEQMARFKGLRPPPTAQEPWYSIRGGAWTDKLASVPAWQSVPVPARWHDPTAGFRCVKDAE